MYDTIKIEKNKNRSEKNMKKKGFTLIELLAVIVILAVIALIATPLIMNVIEDARDGALKNSARYLLKTAEMEYAVEQMNNPNPTIDFNALEYKGERMDAIAGSFDENGKASIAVYKGNKCVYQRFEDEDVILEKGLTEEECLAKVGGEVAIVTLDLVKNHLCNDTVTTECYKEEGNEYVYTGASGTVGNNWLWYAGHQWRIIKADKTTGKYTLITSYPTTAIQWQSNVASGPSLESSYVGDWLNNVFLKSLPSEVQNSLENMTYTRNVYNGSSVVEEEISNVKVRLLTEAEYTTYGGADAYLDIKDFYWLADIYNTYRVRVVSYFGNLDDYGPVAAFGFRPVVEVSNLTYTEGVGTVTEPYIVSTSKASNVKDTYVGDYILVPKTDGSTYLARVVKHDQNGTKVILNGLYEEISGFGSNTTFSTSSTIYTGALTNFRNSLDSNYFDSTNREFNMTRYGNGANYANATTMFTGNIALPSVGEMFSGNDIDISNSTTKTFVDTSKIENPTISSYYWLMNAYSASNIFYVNYDGANNAQPTTPSGVRPTWYLSDMTISSGNGTPSEPYELK